jgi:hypothetical protein
MTEQSLHEQLKALYAEGHPVETVVDGYVIDVVRDNLLIEIQTGNFSGVKPKLVDLLADHRVRVVHPILARKWVIRLDGEGHVVSRRKSPKRGRVEDAFLELVYLSELCLHPHFELEVALVTANEFWMDDGKGSWRRRRWSVYDRRLLQVLETHRFAGPNDYLALLPDDLPQRFTTRGLAAQTGLSRRLARKLVYCFRKMGLLTLRGKTGRTNVYTVAAPRPPLQVHS